MTTWSLSLLPGEPILAVACTFSILVILEYDGVFSSYSNFRALVNIAWDGDAARND